MHNCSLKSVGSQYRLRKQVARRRLFINRLPIDFPPPAYAGGTDLIELAESL